MSKSKIAGMTVLIAFAMGIVLMGNSATSGAEKEALEKIFKDPYTGIEFVLIKGGCYEMGDTFGDGKKDEKPSHKVCVNDFYLGIYEVTQGQWEKVMGNNPSRFKGRDHPVEQVSWNDVQQFISRLNDQSGRKFRLPSEAEWEYAARSGGEREKYAGTSQEGDLGQYAWYFVNSGSQTHPVGEKRPNGLGLYDMSGNVWEWCSDWYGENYYQGRVRYNPEGPGNGSNRVLRGGSWFDDPGFLRAAFRYGFPLPTRHSLFGFRLGLSAQ
jgi:formylglycine-generating enzyme required for sulfatase activity